MAWIESHADLRDHPKTDHLMDLLSLTRRDAVGLLHFIWWRALTYAPDGRLGALTDGQIARWAEWDGDPGQLIEALTEAGFMDEERVLHDWHDYAGRWIERRQANADRMRGARASRSSARVENVQRTYDARAGATGPNRTLTEPNLTGPEDEARAGVPKAAPSGTAMNGNSHDCLDVPAPLAGFHEVLLGSHGYEPSAAFLQQVAERYVALDLTEEALKIVSWLADTRKNRDQKRATTRFILGWLRRELTSQTTKATEGRSSATGARNGHPPGSSLPSDMLARIAEDEQRAAATTRVPTRSEI